jgi:hypothetical protein
MSWHYPGGTRVGMHREVAIEDDIVSKVYAYTQYERQPRSLRANIEPITEP